MIDTVLAVRVPASTLETKLNTFWSGDTRKGVSYS